VWVADAACATATDITLSCGGLAQLSGMHTQHKPTRSTGPRGQVDDKIWVPVVDGPPVTVVRRSPPSLTLARDAVEEQARVRKRTRPVDKAIGRSRVLGVPAELALLHPIQNALGWHDLGLLCHGCRLKRRVAPFGAACRMEGLESRRPWNRLYCNILNPFNRLWFGFTLFG